MGPCPHSCTTRNESLSGEDSKLYLAFYGRSRLERRAGEVLRRQLPSGTSGSPPRRQCLPRLEVGFDLLPAPPGRAKLLPREQGQLVADVRGTRLSGIAVAEEHFGTERRGELNRGDEAVAGCGPKLAVGIGLQVQGPE